MEPKGYSEICKLIADSKITVEKNIIKEANIIAKGIPYKGNLSYSKVDTLCVYAEFTFSGDEDVKSPSKIRIIPFSDDKSVDIEIASVDLMLYGEEFLNLAVYIDKHHSFTNAEFYVPALTWAFNESPARDSFIYALKNDQALEGYQYAFKSYYKF